MGNFNVVQNAPVFLPQNDPDPITRGQGLQAAIGNYQLEQKTFGLTDSHQRLVDIVNLPPMLHKIPKEEKTSWHYFIWISFQFLKFYVYSLYQRLIGLITGDKWTIEQMIQYFRQRHPRWLLQEPKGCEVWRETAINDPNQTPLQRMQADHWFAWQRLNGVTRNLIHSVNPVPGSFVPFIGAIENNHPYLAGINLQQHAIQNTLYVVDLLDIAFGEPTLLAPAALFVIFQNMMMPVAVVINLGNGDQVYLPVANINLNNANTLQDWVRMRMTFNMLEAQYHESITHLGFTHLLMDGVSVCMHRTLSDRHPIYKLLLPHFQFMHAINKTAKDKLLQRGGYVEKDMYIGRILMLKLISRHNVNWQFDPIQNDFQARGVMNTPGYFFRDDALLLNGAIQAFVNNYVTNYYGNNAAVQGDPEIQQFQAELILGRGFTGPNGCGMVGLPPFNNIQNLVNVLTHFIYICSVEHSATNFPQYEQYAFPPNFAAVLHGQPEQNLSLDDCMPTRRETFSTIKIMKVLTLSLTSSLGNYDDKYLSAMDAAGIASVALFQGNLNAIRDQINQRNDNIVAVNNPNFIQEYPYEWLLPQNVLNSISI